MAAFDYSSSNVRWQSLRQQALRRDRHRCQESKRYGKAVESPSMMTYAALAREVQDISYKPSEDVFRFFEQLRYDSE